MGQVSPSFLYATAVLDAAGGFAVLLPSLTRIRPKLTVLAALGCAVLQASAIVFHVIRGETANTPPPERPRSRFGLALASSSRAKPIRRVGKLKSPLRTGAERA